MPVTPANDVAVLDEGTLQGYAREVDFVGAGVTAAISGIRATVTVSGGGGGGGGTNATTTVDFGATPLGEKDFSITDAGVSTTSYIHAWVQHNDTTADNGVEMHKNFGNFGRITCSAGTGSFSAHIGTLIGLMTGQFKFRYNVA